MDFVKVSEGVIQIESLREKARERLSARYFLLVSDTFSQPIGFHGAWCGGVMMNLTSNP
jgi:hypothetical protein